MRYFVVNTTIIDGEYEYMSQSPIEAKNEAQALMIASKDAEDWTRDDYREFECRISTIGEMTKEEFEIVRKYIY